MTTAPSRPSPADAVHAALSDAGVRARIEEIVRRRVQADAVTDVVGQVACEALASPLAPADPDEVPRWLFGITRHKVADHHRASFRRLDAGVDVEQLPGAGAALEARSLLRRVLEDASRDARAAETMRWIVREAAGERLDEMAREVALPPATVRQRVSRLRRWLRKRWLREIALVAAAALGIGVAWRLAPHHVTVPIVADPLHDSAATASAALQGRWHVVRVEPDAALDAGRRALVDAEAMTTVVDVEGARLHLASATRSADRVLDVGTVQDGRFTVRVADGGGTQTATATLDDAGHLVVTSREGAWRGLVVLGR
jgi:DNA-directed RNA polymerase specialized sigma24 family protein